MKLRNTIQIFLSPFDYQRLGSGSYFLQKLIGYLLKLFSGSGSFARNY